jgi:hypothetical protein
MENEIVDPEIKVNGNMEFLLDIIIPTTQGI